jgi:hypothetical protein
VEKKGKQDSRGYLQNCGKNKAHSPDAIFVTRQSLVILVLRSVLQDTGKLNIVEHAVLDWCLPVHFIYLKHFNIFSQPSINQASFERHSNLNKIHPTDTNICSILIYISTVTETST